MPSSIRASAIELPGAWMRASRSPSVRMGASVLLMLVLIALAAPWLGTVDPGLFDPGSRDLLPGAQGHVMTPDGELLAHRFLFGSDGFGRDIYSRVLYGARVSLVVGVATALLASAVGLALGVAAAWTPLADGILMRVMDGLMAIPSIMVAIALVAIWKGGVATVVAAIAIPEIPHVARLVRSRVLSLRQEPYVEAAIALGVGAPRLIWRHVLPSAFGLLVVQATYICAFAIMTESILSFLGVGLSPDIPTWGNVMAEGRAQFNSFPHNMVFPGVFLAVTLLAVNILGDGLRDAMDPKMAARVKP
jgi:peptide/nickel transport system permease protein